MSSAPPSTTENPVEGRAAPADAVLASIADWLPQQRWYPAKGTSGVPERLAVVPLTDPDGEAEVGLHLLRLASGSLLQVPLVLRPDDGTERRGVIATLPGDAGAGRADGGATLVVDGCHDPAFLRAWLAAAEHGEPVELDVTGARVVAGEQSNTSVLLPAASPPAILKVFRGVGTGANPDVEVPLALSRVGWDGVPRPLAWLTGRWPSPPGSRTGHGPGDAPDASDVGHLGVLSELVVGAQDGFELACRYAGGGTDFGDLAEDLGRTTAQMHRALRTALPTESAGGSWPASGAATADPREVVATLRRRAAAAVAAAPVLADRADAVESLLSGVERLPSLPALQRVHGDYHLGQVLRAPERGWAVLDFEGEPQASVEERNRPDLALRDLAGMLRSIDYAAAVGGASSPDWGATARARLVEGYRTEAGAEEGPGNGPAPDATELLRVLELDKALYEVVYESRNRPAWVHIPLEGVDRLLGRAA